MNRRALLATGTAAFTSLAFSGSALAANETKTVPYDKLFMFLSNYYNLPPTERTLFKMNYGLVLKGAKLDQVSLILNAGGASQRLNIDSHGVVSPIPTAEQVKAKATLTITRPAGAEFGTNLMITPTAQPQPVMDAAPLNGAVAQTAAGAKKMAGLMAMAIPKFDRVMIFGPTSAKVILANGEAKPLPVKPAFTDKDGDPHPSRIVYVPADWPTAKNLSFDTTPVRLLVAAAG